MDSIDTYPLLRSVLLCYAGAASAFVLFLAIRATYRWRKGEAIVNSGEGRRALEDGCNILWFSSFIAIPEHWGYIWSGAGWGELAVVIATTALLLQVSGSLATRRIARQQEHARVNDKVHRGAPQPPPVPIDWSCEARLAVIVVPALAFYIGGVFAAIWLGKAANLSSQLCAALALAWLLAIPLLVAFMRWPGRIHQSHTLIIDAAPQLVWDTLHCRETNHYYRAPTARIEKVAGSNNRFVWHYAELGVCPSCGLPREAGRSHSSTCLNVEVVEQIPGRSARQVATFPPGTPFRDRLLLREENSFSIAPHGGGAAITYETSVVGARLWAAALTLSGNIPKDLLEDLKAHLEGTRSKGVFGSGRHHREQADLSPRLCGCA